MVNLPVPDIDQCAVCDAVSSFNGCTGLRMLCNDVVHDQFAEVPRAAALRLWTILYFLHRQPSSQHVNLQQGQHSGSLDVTHTGS